MSSVASNWCRFRTFLSLGNRKKSYSARSGEYGGCCNWAVLCLAKNCCTRWEVCAGALSWCRIQSPSRHFSSRFQWTDSLKRRTVIRCLLYCQSPVIVNDCSNFSNYFLVSRCWRSSQVGVAFNGGSTLFKSTEPVKHLCRTHCIFTVCLLQWLIRFCCSFSDFKTKLDANALFGTFTHCKNRYDINTHVTSATYYSQLSKCSHFQLVSWVDKTCMNMSRLVANTSHLANNHYNSNPDAFWTNLMHPSLGQQQTQC